MGGWGYGCQRDASGASRVGWISMAKDRGLKSLPLFHGSDSPQKLIVVRLNQGLRCLLSFIIQRPNCTSMVCLILGGAPEYRYKPTFHRDSPAYS